jgi:hypothetical protein
MSVELADSGSQRFTASISLLPRLILPRRRAARLGTSSMWPPPKMMEEKSAVVGHDQQHGGASLAHTARLAPARLCAKGSLSMMPAEPSFWPLSRYFVEDSASAPE